MTLAPPFIVLMNPRGYPSVGCIPALPASVSSGKIIGNSRLLTESALSPFQSEPTQDEHKHVVLFAVTLLNARKIIETIESEKPNLRKVRVRPKRRGKEKTPGDLSDGHFGLAKLTQQAQSSDPGTLEHLSRCVSSRPVSNWLF